MPVTKGPKPQTRSWKPTEVTFSYNNEGQHKVQLKIGGRSIPIDSFEIVSTEGSTDTVLTMRTKAFRMVIKEDNPNETSVRATIGEPALTKIRKRPGPKPNKGPRRPNKIKGEQES